MTPQIDKTYMLRNGMRVYIHEIHSVNSDILLGYGEDGICHHFRRDNGKSHICLGYWGNPPLNNPSMDIVSEAMGLEDLKEEYLAYERHIVEQRRVAEEIGDSPNGYELYREWNRKHRPPGPLRPGMSEKDYD